MKALVNFEIAQELACATDLDVIPLNPYNKLDKPVSAHADMLFCILDNTVFCYKDYVEAEGLYDIIKDEGYNIVFVSNECEKKYPNDVSLNVLVMGKTIFCNVKYTAREIIDYANENDYTVVNVNQGYSACSTLALDENNAITGDKGMEHAITRAGKNALLIETDDIILSGYDSGFIGGASAVLGEKILFFGPPKALLDGCKIVDYLLELDHPYFFISLDRVYDFGGIKLI